MLLRVHMPQLKVLHATTKTHSSPPPPKKVMLLRFITIISCVTSSLLFIEVAFLSVNLPWFVYWASCWRQFFLLLFGCFCFWFGTFGPFIFNEITNMLAFKFTTLFCGFCLFDLFLLLSFLAFLWIYGVYFF